jgi:hypothetical protein
MTPEISDEARKCDAAKQLLDDLDAQTYAPNRFADLAIIQRHLSAYAIAYHESKSKELVRDKERKEWLLSQCKIVHFIRDEANDLGNYPVEHYANVGKLMIDDNYIDTAMNNTATKEKHD